MLMEWVKHIRYSPVRTKQRTKKQYNDTMAGKICLYFICGMLISLKVPKKCLWNLELKTSPNLSIDFKAGGNLILYTTECKGLNKEFRTLDSFQYLVVRDGNVVSRGVSHGSYTMDLRDRVLNGDRVLYYDICSKGGEPVLMHRSITFIAPYFEPNYRTDSNNFMRTRKDLGDFQNWSIVADKSNLQDFSFSHFNPIVLYQKCKGDQISESKIDSFSFFVVRNNSILVEGFTLKETKDLNLMKGDIITLYDFRSQDFIIPKENSLTYKL